MYEENRSFSWANLFIKIIIVVIFILFTIWLLSLSMKSTTKGLSDSLNVLTDNIFSENISRMKEVGKEYFTTERLPQKVGEVKTLTLDKMYKDNLILEVKDKNGKACSAKNSYVSVEKMETEYQMKVYLECGEESNFIKVIMGCYNYCDTDICERKVSPSKAIEYEYSKTTGGSWSPWGNWSEWSKVSVDKTDYRDVETKVVKEDYTYDKLMEETVYTGEAACETIDGYTLINDENGVCTYRTTKTDKKDPVCPSVSGYILKSRDGFTCTYTQGTTSTTDPVCPSVSGYTLSGRNGFNCTYTKQTTATADPTCPSVSGYTLSGRNGFTCTYTKQSTVTANPTCPSLSGYSLKGRDGFTCTYTKSTTSYINPTCPKVSGYELTGRSGFTCNYRQSYQVPVGTKTVTPCSGCGVQVITVYETRYRYTTKTATCSKGTKSGNSCAVTSTESTTKTATCPDGYSKSGSTCVKNSTETTTKPATCPEGYSQSGNTCVKPGTETISRTASCPEGYTQSGNTCVKNGTNTVTKTASCPEGYSQSENTCVKSSTINVDRDAVCADGEQMKNGKCYAVERYYQRITEKRNVTYYRYRLRSYSGGVTDYKWSSSNNDSSLINAGYKLTGKTREVGGK